MILYHITEPKHIISILLQGLIPNHRRGLTCGSRDKRVVWLTNKPSHIIETQCLKNWVYTILKVDCTGLDICQYKVYHLMEYPDGCVVPYEYLYYGKINESRISVYPKRKQKK